MTDRDPYEELGLVDFTGGQLAVIEALSDAYPRRLSLRDLIDSVYQLDPNGGPTYAENVIRVHITKLRKKLPEHGWMIPSNRAGRENVGFYRLEPVANDNVPAADRAAKDRRAAA